MHLPSVRRNLRSDDAGEPILCQILVLWCSFWADLRLKFHFKFVQFVGNIVGLILTFTLAAAIRMRSSYTGVVTPAATFIMSILTGCVAAIMFFNGEYKRLAHERGQEGDGEREGEGEGEEGAATQSEVVRSPRPGEAVVEEERESENSSGLLAGRDARAV